MYKQILIVLCVALSLGAHAQRYDTISIFNSPIQMDEVVVKAARAGWDVNSFIRRIQNDTTFYKAFLGLHITPFTAINDIRVLNKDGRVSASLYSKTRQNIKGNCRTMDVLEQRTTGDFFKRDKTYNYYTAQLYAYLFFTTGSVCNDNDIVAGKMASKGSGQLEKSKYQLKQLIFNPGSKISGVPFMGDKASIFDPEQSQKYDFKLSSETYDDAECYVFKAVPKKGEESNVIYNELTTWFRKSDYSIVARDYSLSFSTLVYDFDVHMKVRTAQVGKRLLPTDIYYDGNWHIITKKRERVKFETHITY